MLDMAVIEIGEEKYTLCYPLSALRKADKIVNTPLNKLFTPQDMNMPEYDIEDLVYLFRLGLQKEHPTIDNKKADELFEAFLREGKSLLAQSLIMYLQIGKAMGFFRTEADFQQQMKSQIQKQNKEKETLKEEPSQK